MKKIFLMGLLAFVLMAATNNTDNKSGSSYGSAVDIDTAYVSWDGLTYYDLRFHGARSLYLDFKSNIQASDTVFFFLMGTSIWPDSLRFYHIIAEDTLEIAAPGDSTIQFSYPADQLPRYIKMRLILNDGASGATATIASGLYTE